MTPTDFGKALEFTCSLRYVLDAVKAASAARAEHMDRTRADREIDQFASASAGGSGGVPNRQGIDVPVNTAQPQPTADVGAHGVPHIGCRYLCPVNGVCNKCGYIDHSGPAVDSQAGTAPTVEEAWRAKLLRSGDYRLPNGRIIREQSSGPAIDSQLTSEPSPEGAGASAAGSADPSGRFTDGGKTWEPAASQVQGALTPLGEAMEWLHVGSRDYCTQQHHIPTILSHIAAQQAEIEKLTSELAEANRTTVLSDQITRQLSQLSKQGAELSRLAADRDRLARELEEAKQQLNKATECTHPSSHGWGSLSSVGGFDGESWCDRCGKQLTFRKPLAAMPTEKL